MQKCVLDIKTDNISVGGTVDGVDVSENVGARVGLVVGRGGC